MRALKTFEVASGLAINQDKTDLYTNGVSSMEKSRILKMSGFIAGTFPFKHLGIPISYKRLSIVDCNRLVKKIVAILRSLGGRRLSYAGRKVLIQAVFSQLHSYWARIFLIAIIVIKKIEGIYRNFLWSGDDQFKSPLISWDQCCKPKKNGGLGFLNFSECNKASISKFTWWIASKQNHLWIKWVNAIYIRNKNWWDYSSSIKSSWAWRQICKVKEIFKSGYTNNLWQAGDYTVRSGYEWIHTLIPKVRWWHVVWNRLCAPKHSFILWLYNLNRLSTRDILFQRGIIQVTTCFLCQQADETRNLLFIQCEFSNKCLELVHI
ncbi:uncharacterized protein LOC141638257 [Silene latifolia]|uniref:uncharacterized protein LOC141638257 n=1 Tax=Silene latifolia TaxID=37657 RepID=UPI003D77F650